MPLLVLAAPNSELGPAVPMVGVPGRFIGASLDLEATKNAGGKFRFTFDPCPVSVEDHPVYRRAVLDGHLIAVDVATAKACGVELDAAAAKKASEALKARDDAKAKAKAEAAKADAEAAKAASPKAPPAPETSPETPAATAERKGARKES